MEETHYEQTQAIFHAEGQRPGASDDHDGRPRNPDRLCYHACLRPLKFLRYHP